MPKSPQRSGAKFLSDGELSVLEMLWKCELATPSELHEALDAEGTKWAYPTVQTLLHRMLEKGYVKRERQGRNQVYEATLDRVEVIAREMEHMAQRYCAGSRSPLLQGLLQTKNLTRKEIAELRRTLDEHSQGSRKKPRKP